MAVSYDKLAQMLKEKNISWAQLQKEAGYSANITTRLRSNSYVSLESVEKICKALNCTSEKIMDFTQEE